MISTIHTIEQAVLRSAFFMLRLFCQIDIKLAALDYFFFLQSSAQPKQQFGLNVCQITQAAGTFLTSIDNSIDKTSIYFISPFLALRKR